MPPFFHHTCGMQADNFRADRTRSDGTDFLELNLKRIAFLSDQRWICGDAVENSCTCGATNLVEVGGIEKEFHILYPFLVHWWAFDFERPFELEPSEPEPSGL